MHLIGNKAFLRILARLNIQNTDFVFVYHIEISFLTIKIPLYRVIQRGKQRMDAFLCQKCPTKNGGSLLLFLQELLG